jgi:phosphate-selective porin OprO and OprP
VGAGEKTDLMSERAPTPASPDSRTKKKKDKVPSAFAVLMLLVPVAGAAQPQQSAQEPPRPPVRMDWNPRPSIRLGDIGRIDFRLKLQGDFRSFDPEQDPDLETFELHRRRAGIEGVLFRRLEFEIERELRKRGPWRDVFLNLDAANWLEIKGGKFKVPFGLEETTGTTDLDFIFRTLASDTIAPARDVGGMAHGRIRRALTYEVGVFREDGENARLTEPVFLLPGEAEPRGGRIFAARIVAAPILRGRSDERFRIGVAVTSSELPEGLNSLRGRTVFGSAFFPRVYVRGRRMRFGTEAEWNPGRFGLRAEYMRATDDRDGQGLGDVDLSDLIARGWYGSATWVITGERKGGGIRPRTPLFEGGIGAVEVGTRLEELSFGSIAQEGAAFRNPRAAHIAENRERVWTTGVNWLPNRWTKIQLNGIREHILDDLRTPVAGQQTYWTAIARLQLVL